MLFCKLIKWAFGRAVLCCAVLCCAVCCSARSGTAMDLGLDYCRVLLALGFVSSSFCTPKSAWPVGVIGVSRQALSGFYKTVLCCAVTAVLCCAVLPAYMLCCAVLCGSVCCAVLCCAVLCCAVLCCAVPCCAVLCCAVLCCAVLC
jgi:hypothetical protein